MFFKYSSAIIIILVAFIIHSWWGTAESSSASDVKYPEGYRNWTHVKSMVLQPGHQLYEAFGGIHHIYANDKALKAMKSGAPYPDGSVIVFDLLEAQEADNAIVEGARKVLGVMEKNSRKFASTGGWGWEGFKGDTKVRVVTDPTTQCYTCHISQKDRDYVFSSFRN
ncbi:MAG: cytochrome C [Calditrichaeota bacterium]|nr:MAG: cytochrome C [Calditrichota bacterium]